MTKHQPASTSLNDLASLNAELAALVRARIPLEPELRRLSRQLPKGSGELANRLATRMEQGSDLAAAVAAEGETLPAVYRAAITAGLESGNPAAALEDVAESSRRLASLRQTTGISLIIPMVVVVVASLLLSVLVQVAFTDFAWIAPRTLRPYEEFASNPWVVWILAVLIPALAVGVPLLWWVRSRGATGLTAPRWSVLGWVPGGRRLHRLGAAATLAEVLRIMVASGAPLDRSLRVAADATSDRKYRLAATVLADRCAAGCDLSGRDDRLVDQHIRALPPLVRVAVRQCGHRQLLTTSLARAARSYHERAESLGGALSDYVPGLLTVGVAGTVTAAYTIGLIWPYTTMLHTMADGLWR